MRRLWLSLLFVLAAPALFAADVVAPGVSTNAWEKLLGDDAVVDALLKVLVLAVGIAWAYYKVMFKLVDEPADTATKRIKKRVVETIQQVVEGLYVETVRDLKAKTEDGKLSQKDIQNLQSTAWERTQEKLKAEGVELAKVVAKEFFPAVLSKIITLAKKGGS